MGLSFFIFRFVTVAGSDTPPCGLASQSENGRGFCDSRYVAFIALLAFLFTDIRFVRRHQGIGNLVGKSTSTHQRYEGDGHYLFVFCRLPDLWSPSDEPLSLVGSCALLWGMSVSNVGD